MKNQQSDAATKSQAEADLKSWPYAHNASDFLNRGHNKQLDLLMKETETN